MDQKPTHYLMPAPLRDALLGYLGTRPLSEVLEGYAHLQRLQPHVPAPVPQDRADMPSLGQPD